MRHKPKNTKRRLSVNKVQQPRRLVKEVKAIWRIPFFGIIGVLFSAYFALEPDIRTKGGIKENFSESRITANGHLAIRSSVEITLINYSLRPGFIDRMELIPYGIGGSNLKIFDVSIEKDYLYFLKPKTIKIDYSTSENDLEINPKEWVKGDSLYHGDQMSMSFYDNYKSPVTYIDGKTVYYAIGGTTVASNPAFLKSNEK